MPNLEENLSGQRILLIITGGISAYKSLELIRLLKEQGANISCVLTDSGSKFITQLSVETLIGKPVNNNLFSLTKKNEINHIDLARNVDLVVIAPATADFIAKMAHGLADDLASTLVLATNSQILLAPAMNTQMWNHPATQRNIKIIKQDGINIANPTKGDLACGENGIGRMLDPEEILLTIQKTLQEDKEQQLTGVKVLVTSGPTHEALDPVRYLGNLSSGKQGYAVAAALAERGAKVELVSGPTQEQTPFGVKIHRVQNAREMLAAAEASLPVDVAICTAAVADWRVKRESVNKIKKSGQVQTLELIENPDILASLSQRSTLRPSLVIGFSAETQSNSQKLIKLANQKRSLKGCDWMLANDISSHTGVLGGEMNTVHFITDNNQESWPKSAKTKIATRLAEKIADHISSSALPPA